MLNLTTLQTLLHSLWSELTESPRGSDAFESVFQAALKESEGASEINKDIRYYIAGGAIPLLNLILRMSGGPEGVAEQLITAEPHEVTNLREGIEFLLDSVKHRLDIVTLYSDYLSLCQICDLSSTELLDYITIWRVLNNLRCTYPQYKSTWRVSAEINRGFLIPLTTLRDYQVCQLLVSHLEHPTLDSVMELVENYYVCKVLTV